MAPATLEHNPISQESRDMPVNHRGRTLGAEGKPYQWSRCACRLCPQSLTVEAAGIEPAALGRAARQGTSAVHTSVKEMAVALVLNVRRLEAAELAERAGCVL